MSDLPTSPPPMPPLPEEEKNDFNLADQEITTVNASDQFPSNREKSKSTIVMAVLGLLFILASTPLAVYLVGQRQEVRKEAEAIPTPPFILQSQDVTQETGRWQAVDFYGYPQGCNSAGSCNLEIYPTTDNWISLDYDDAAWQAGYNPVSQWWEQAGWACKNTLLAGVQTLGLFEPDSQGKFPDLNGRTTLYRKKFSLNLDSLPEITTVTLDVFSDNKTALYLNGQLLGSNLETCYSPIIDPQILQNGENILAIQLSNDRTDPFNKDNPLGLAYKLTINFAGLPEPTNTPVPTATPTPLPGQFLCAEYQVEPGQEFLPLVFQPESNKGILGVNFKAHDFNNDMWAKLELCPRGQTTGCTLIIPDNLREGSGDDSHPDIDEDNFFNIRTHDYSDRHCAAADESPYPADLSGGDEDCYIDHPTTFAQCLDSDQFELRATLKNEAAFDHAFICVEWQYCEPLACTDLTKDKQALKIGDNVTFTCTGNPAEELDHFNFRYQVGGGNYVYLNNIAPLAGNPNQGETALTVNQEGTWHIQCQVCPDANNNCTAWGAAQ